MTLAIFFVNDAGLVELIYFYSILQAKTEKMDKTVSLICLGWFLSDNLSESQFSRRE